ncbi:unnamed protein product, partial [Meganyctiphanes norvegica]
VYSSRIFWRCVMFLVTVTSNLYMLVNTAGNMRLISIEMIHISLIPFIAAAGQILPFFTLCCKADRVYSQSMSINTFVKNLQGRQDISMRGQIVLQAISQRLDARPALIGIGSVGNLNTSVMVTFMNVIFTYLVIIYQTKPAEEGVDQA